MWTAGRSQQWNVTLERQLPMDVSVSLAYVGTRTDGGYADINVNYAEAGGGDAGRQLFAQAGTAEILDWAARTKRRYNALQTAINRPFKNGLLLKGAYTWSKAMDETDDDGWVDADVEPAVAAEPQLRAGGLRQDPQLLDGLPVRSAVCEERYRRAAGDCSRTGRSTASTRSYSGTPFTIGGDNTALNQRGGQQTIQQIAPIRQVGPAGPERACTTIRPSFAQPGNQWGNTGRNFLRGPVNYNLDMGLFRGFPVGHYRARVPDDGQQRAESCAVGQPGDGLH